MERDAVMPRWHITPTLAEEPEPKLEEWPTSTTSIEIPSMPIKPFLTPLRPIKLVEPIPPKHKELEPEIFIPYKYREFAKRRRMSIINNVINPIHIPTMHQEHLMERYTTYPDHILRIYDDLWWAQQITVGNTGLNLDHELTKIKLMLYRIDATGNMRIQLKAVDAAGKPTGAALSTGTRKTDDLPTWPNHQWLDINMSPYNLKPDTTYTIVIDHQSGDATHYIKIGMDDTLGTYTGGRMLSSDDSGATWLLIPLPWDTYFKTYGKPL